MGMPSKPKAGEYEVRYQPGFGYAVLDPKGRRLPGWYGSRDRALTRRDKLQSEADASAKRGARPCLCCGHTFQSAGIHNRLCDRCRSADAGPEWQRPYIAASGKAA